MEIRYKVTIMFSVMYMLMIATMIIAPAFSGPPHYHEEGNVNYPSSYFEPTYIVKGIGVDDYITVVDLALMARALGKSSSEPWGVGWGLYNPDADINDDSIVDVRDIAIATFFWGLNYQYSTFPSGTPPTRVRVVVPPGPPISVGSQFPVDIKIQSVIGLNTYEFTLSWDKDLLEVKSIAPDGFLSGNVGGDFILNNNAGYLYFGAATAEETTASGNGILTTITFECLAKGKTTLDLSSRLFDVDLNSINHRDFDSSIKQA